MAFKQLIWQFIISNVWMFNCNVLYGEVFLCGLAFKNRKSLKQYHLQHLSMWPYSWIHSVCYLYICCRTLLLKYTYLVHTGYILIEALQYFCAFIILGHDGLFLHPFIRPSVHVWIRRDALTTTVCVASFVVMLDCCSLSKETTVCHSHRNRFVFISP